MLSGYRNSRAMFQESGDPKAQINVEICGSAPANKRGMLRLPKQYPNPSCSNARLLLAPGA